MLDKKRQKDLLLRQRHTQRNTSELRANRTPPRHWCPMGELHNK